MKILLLVLLLSSFIQVVAQSDTATEFYDREGNICARNNAVKFSLRIKENDHYKKLMVDGMDNKIESIAYFTDINCQTYDGPYRELYKNGHTRKSGYYFQNKKTNAWKTWSNDGILTDSFFYLDGYINGVGLSWNKDGKIIDSLIFEKDGKGVGRGFWDNGNPAQRGGFVRGKRDGTWTYYYQTGKKSQEVIYVADSAVSYVCYDEHEKLQEKDCIYEREASFPGGEKKWKQYLNNKLNKAHWPNDYYNRKIYGQVWVQFAIDTDGSITDLKIVQSVDHALDEMVLSIFKDSPKWESAVQYNRPVKAYRKQPVSFNMD